MELRKRVEKLEEAAEPTRGGMSCRELVRDDGTIIKMIVCGRTVILLPSSRRAVKDEGQPEK